MRTYLGYVPTSDTEQIPIFQFYTPTSPHNNTQTIPNRRDTPQVCPPGSNKRFPPEIFPLPFGHKKSLERFLLRGSKGAVTYSPDFSVPSARRGLTSRNPRAMAALFYFFFRPATLCRRCAIKIIDWKQTPFTLRASGVISLRSLSTAVLFPGPPSPNGRGKPSQKALG